MRKPVTTEAAPSRPRAEGTRADRLSPEAERDLFLRYRRGDQSAREPLVAGCLGYVVVIALEYRRWGVPVEDLVQEGNIGLLKALDHFDPDRGVRLAQYARFWIRAQIRELVVRQYRIVNLGGSKGERRALRLYRKTGERRPDVLAAMCGISTERAAAMLPVLVGGGELSLSPLREDDRQGLLDRISDHAATPEEALCAADEGARLRAALAQAVSTLPEREQIVVRRRLLSEDPETLERIGADWGVSKERVRQIEEAAKARMRARLQSAV